MRRLCICGVLTCLLLNTLTTNAQEQELDPVAVSASLSPEKTSRTGRNIFVIRGDKFANLPVHSIDDLLRYLPGLEVQARGPMGAQSDLVLRGGTFQQVLVVLDGVRLNDPITGHFSSYIPLAPAEIDRIELLKGAASAIYGADAVGGVIHIFTKAFTAVQGIQRSSAGAQLTVGEYGLLNGKAGGFYSNGKTAIGAGIVSNNASGQPLRGTRGYFHNHSASLSLAHYFTSRLNLALRTGYDDRDFAAQNFYTASLADTATERVRSLWNQLQLTYTGSKHTMRLSAGYKHMKDSFAFNPKTPANINRSALWQALLTDDIRVSEKAHLVTGIQFVNKGIRSNDRGNHNNTQAAAFVTWNQQAGAHFFLAPAVRAEWNERSGWELVPQVNVSYRHDQFQLRASAGKTIRDADFTERFNNYNRTLVASGNRIGNPALEAERSFSYEGGADFFIGHNLKLSATYFKRDHSNLIDYIRTPYANMPRKENLSPTGVYDLAKNVSKVETSGYETDLQYARRWGNAQQFWLSAGWVWISSNSSNNQPSFYVSSHAKFLTNFSAQYSNKWFSIGVNGLYKERQPMSAASPHIAAVSADYFVMNAKLEAFVWKRMATVFVQADNLFDRSFTDLLGSRMPGRWFMGGFRISLDHK